MSKSGWTSMYMYIVGTPSNIVALCAAMLRQNLAGIEAGMQHELEAVHHRGVEDDVAVDVRARQGGDDDVRARLQVELSGHRHIQDNGAVRLHRALGMAGRAGRVADGR